MCFLLLDFAKSIIWYSEVQQKSEHVFFLDRRLIGRGVPGLSYKSMPVMLREDGARSAEPGVCDAEARPALYYGAVLEDEVRVQGLRLCSHAPGGGIGVPRAVQGGGALGRLAHGGCAGALSRAIHHCACLRVHAHAVPSSRSMLALPQP